MSVFRTVMWSMLAMLVPIVPIVRAQGGPPPPPHDEHLRPMNDPYSEDPIGYDEAVSRVLLGGKPTAAELQMVVLPWRRVEEMVAVRAKGAGFVVEHVKLKESLRRAVGHERERLSRKNVHAPKEIAAALASVDVGARRTTAPIEGALLAAVKGVWNDMLVDSARWRRSGHQMLDGDEFQLAGRAADGRYRWAAAHSPEDGSRCGRLLAIAEALIAFAEASPADRPPISRKIVEEAGALRAELARPQRQEPDDRQSASDE
jgi:hypothetical protein